MIQYYFKKIVVSLCSLLGVFILIALLVWSNPISESIKTGLNICLYTLIPSLFVFMSISSFFMKTGLLKYVLYPFSLLCSKLFKVDVSLGPLLFMSLIGGYPVGAKLLSELVCRGSLKKQDAERLLCYCVNAGPAFLIGAVSVPIYRSVTLGFALFISNVIAFFIIGTLTAIGKQPIIVSAEKTRTDIAGALVDSVYSSIKAMGLVCGFVLLFSAFLGLLEYTNLLKILTLFPGFVLGSTGGEVLIKGLLEVTTGVQSCANVYGLTGFILIAVLTSFGGLSVHCQIKSILIPSRISMKQFYRWRIVSMAICAGFSYLFLRFTDSPISTFMDYNGQQVSYFSFTPIASIFLIILAIMLLLNIKNSVKINKDK